MNYIDVGLIVLIVVIGFRGFATGFIAEVCSFAGIVAGVYLGSLYAESMGGMLASTFNGIYTIDSPTARYWIGFVMVLLLCWILGLALSLILMRRFSFGALDFINRGLGFIFSSIKVFFMLSFIVYGVSQLEFVKQNFVKIAKEKSDMYETMIKWAQYIIKIPNQSLQENTEQLQENIKQTTDSIMSNIE